MIVVSPFMKATIDRFFKLPSKDDDRPGCDYHRGRFIIGAEPVAHQDDCEACKAQADETHSI